MVKQVTYLTQEKSEEKTPQIRIEEYSYIRYLESKGNATCTKSMIVYEILQMTDVVPLNIDYVDEREEQVDEKLKELISPTFPDDLANGIKVEANYNKHLDVLSNEKISPEDRDHVRINVNIPCEMDEELGWGFNSTLEEAIQQYSAMPFSDRIDRIRFKEDLISYLESGEDPDHEVAKHIVNGSYSTYDIDDEIRDEVLGNSEKWYYSLDLTYDEVKSIQNSNQALSKKSSIGKRESVVRTLIENEGWSKSETIDYYTELFDVKPSTARRTLKRLENKQSIDYNPVRPEIKNEEPDDVIKGTLIAYSDCNRNELAVLLDKMAESENAEFNAVSVGHGLALADNITKVPKDIDDIENRHTKKVCKFIKKLDDEVGLDNVKVEKGRVKEDLD